MDGRFDNFNADERRQLANGLRGNIAACESGVLYGHDEEGEAAAKREADGSRALLAEIEEGGEHGE